MEKFSEWFSTHTLIVTILYILLVVAIIVMWAGFSRNTKSTYLISYVTTNGPGSVYVDHAGNFSQEYFKDLEKWLMEKNGVSNAAVNGFYKIK